MADRCPRFKNLLITQYGETRCYACGYYENVELRSPEPDALMKSGAKLPCILESKRKATA